MTVPEDGGVPGGAPPESEVVGEAAFPPPVPLATGSQQVEPAPDPQELERSATAQRNKDALARLGRKVAGVTQSAADATGTVAREAAARATETAGAVREQVAERVDDLTGPAAGPQPAYEGPSPGASSVVVQPVAGAPGSGGEVVQDTVRGAGDRAAGVAREAGDRAAAAGQQAVAAGRSAVDSGQQAAAVAGQEVAAWAQRTGEAAQQAGAAAVSQTRTALGDAVVGGRAAVRERTAPPIDLEGLAAQVLALPGVARLAPDTAGRGRGLLPGQVAGAQVTNEAVTLRVVARYGTRLPHLADRIHELAARYAEGRQTVVEIPELDVTEHDRDPDLFAFQKGTS